MSVKINNLCRDMKKMNETIHVIQVGYDNYNGLHLTKDCDLDENENKNAQV